MATVDDTALDTLFRDARTYYSWADTPVIDADIRRLYDLVALAPTAANSEPARFVFCRSAEARATLADCASDANAPKIRLAPVTVVIGMDMAFYDRLSTLFPHADARSWFAGNDREIKETAFRNSALQGAYLIMAARALGFDCGPMSGFDKAKVDAAFFAGTTFETNFLCSIGHGTAEKLFPRLHRLGFDEAARFA